MASGCSSVGLKEHHSKVEALRARLPCVTRIGLSRSMETVLPSGSHQTVRSKPYDQIQAGDMAVFWPYGWNWPVCHFVGGHIGTDSWSTHPMGGAGDDTYRWILTRDNYIGVIWPGSR